MIGENALNILLINTVVPLLFAYGGRNKFLSIACVRPASWRVSAGTQSIVTAFARSGIEVHNAGDTQSLIQLKREYCEKRKCLYCRIGFRLLNGVLILLLMGMYVFAVFVVVSNKLYISLPAGRKIYTKWYAYCFSF